MKNLIQVKTNVKCFGCSKNAFFCLTPCGADFTTCPMCGAFDHLNSQNDNEKYEFLYEEEFDDDNRIKFSFCDKCKIMYLVGCTHSMEGCSDNVYNAHVIGKWMYKNEEYTGMPQFNNIDEWFDKANDVQVLQLICINDNLICDKNKEKVKHYDHYKKNNVFCCNLMKNTHHTIHTTPHTQIN